jgi:hypothetical protein
MSGACIYRGPSMLDGSPIIVIATGLGKGSRNTKTGALIQTWIIREDVNPVAAIHSGEDASICGACPHRGTIVDGRNTGRSCYVTVPQAPLNVWKSYHRGIYPMLSKDEARATMAGLRVRLGAYGDPAAVPFHVWANLLAEADAFTGYTHQWRNIPAEFSRFVMASCDSLDDYRAAKALGYRTFRVRAANDATEARELTCPASKEAGMKTTCAACIACGGTSAKAKVDITIIAHGGAVVVRNFNKRAA